MVVVTVELVEVVVGPAVELVVELVVVVIKGHGFGSQLPSPIGAPPL
jgi:hypothetical protein